MCVEREREGERERERERDPSCVPPGAEAARRCCIFDQVVSYAMRPECAAAPAGGEGGCV